jgi:type IV secretion system protein VirB10
VSQFLRPVRTGETTLIAEGTRSTAKISFGQSRVFLIWTRVIMPPARAVRWTRGRRGLISGGNLAKAAAISTMLAIGSELMINNNNAVVEAMRTSTENIVNQENFSNCPKIRSL